MSAVRSSRRNGVIRRVVRRGVQSRLIVASLACGAMAVCAAPGEVAQAAGPAWGVSVSSPTRVEPGTPFAYRVAARNIGDADTDGNAAIDVTLPDGVTGVSVSGSLFGSPPGPLIAWTCNPASGSTIHCDTAFPLPVSPGQAHPEVLLFEVATDPVASGPRVADFAVSGGGAVAASNSKSVSLSTTPDFGVASLDEAVSDPVGGAFTQAAGHPASASVTFELNRTLDKGLPEADGGDLRDARVDLPPGLIGDPTAAPKCAKGLKIPNNVQADQSNFDSNGYCQLNTIVGTADVKVTVNETGAIERFVGPVFNLEPPPGVAAQFGFSFTEQKVILDASVRSDGDYGVTVPTRNANQGKTVLGSAVTLWGVPADHSHDNRRCLAFVGSFTEVAPLPECTDPQGRSWLLPNAANIPARAFLTNPTACTPAGVGLGDALFVDSWDPASAPDQASFFSHLPPGLPLPPEDWGAPQGPNGCEKVPFDPAMDVEADTSKADSPAGLAVDLAFPQDGLSNPNGLATGHLKRASVTLPDGWSVSPSSADGLVGCSDAQSSVGTPLGAQCPEASKIGTVEATTPLLDEKLSGGVYVGTQESDDPLSGRMFRMFIALNSEERGIHVKLPGQIRIDRPTAGRSRRRSTTTRRCRCRRSRCASRADRGRRWRRRSTAGPSRLRRSSSPGRALSSRARRPDRRLSRRGKARATFTRRGDQQPRRQAFQLRAARRSSGWPAGDERGGAADADWLAGHAQGRAALFRRGCCRRCVPGGVAGRYGHRRRGPGRQSVLPAGRGVSDRPVQEGSVRAGGRGSGEGGPVRSRHGGGASAADRRSGRRARGRASDPLPTILKGVPIRLRSLKVDVDRANFILNPTSCRAKSAVGVVRLARRVAVHAQPRRSASSNCAALPLKPRLKVALTGKGQTTDGKHPGVKATVAQRRGDANLKRVQVRLPLSLGVGSGERAGVV